MVFFDAILDESESAIDYLLVELKFIFFLLEFFFRGFALDRVEVHQFVLSVVPEELRVELCTLEHDFVLFLPGLINLVVVSSLHLVRFLFHLGNLALQVFESCLSLFLLLVYIFHNNFLVILLFDDLLLKSVQISFKVLVFLD